MLILASGFKSLNSFLAQFLPFLKMYNFAIFFICIGSFTGSVQKRTGSIGLTLLTDLKDENVVVVAIFTLLNIASIICFRIKTGFLPNGTKIIGRD